MILGCLLGMSTLLLHDSQKTEERKREKEFQNMIENENRDEIQVYVNKLQGELRQAEKALLHSERALVRLTPLVSSDEEVRAFCP